MSLKPEVRRTIRYSALMLGAVLGLMLLVLAAPALMAARYDREFWNELCKGYLYLTPNAGIRATSANGGHIGTSTVPLRGVYVRKVDSDSLVADKAVIDTVEVGTTVGGPNGSMLQWVVNHTGAPVGAGRFMVARATSIKAVNPVGTTGFAANRAINDSLNTWIPATRGAKMLLAVRCVGTTATSDSVYVKGKDENGATQTKKFALVSGVSKTTLFISGSGKAAVKVYWTKVDSVSFAGIAAAPAGADSAALEAYPIGAVTVATSASDGDFVGVSVDSMGNKALGRVCIHGPVDGRVNAATTALTPGSMLELAGWGGAVTDAAATTGRNVGWALEYANQDSLLTRIFVDKY